MIRTRILRGYAPAIGACVAALAAALQAGCGAAEMENDGEEDPVEAALALSGSGSSCNGSGGIAPLRCAVRPSPTGGDIVNAAAAIRLGKALFWDTQTGGDGQVACATCHFHGGTDARLTNTVNPGPDTTFNIVAGPGATLLNFVSFNADDRIGAQGVVKQIFSNISSNPNVAADVCTPDASGIFGTERQVTGRNAPSTIGALFNRDNFWDGRANHRFNGRDPFGATANASAFLINPPQNDASLASQSVGPPENGVEMSCAGRLFNGPNSLGEKMLARAALRLQLVSPTDSVLGAYSAAPANGLRCGGSPCTYATLINDAFGQGAGIATSQFSRFFGQAIQAYEATLIPDSAPIDRFLQGDQQALTTSQQKGLGIFTSGKGACTSCHGGPELSDATLGNFLRQGPINEDGGDQGFHNLGVRPTFEDLGRAGLGPNNVSFSVSHAAADRGAFKTPQLRNLKLTAPYFHNGDKATIADVVDFYMRGGDFANPEKAKRINAFSLQPDQRAGLIDFLTNGLTDCRVEKDAAPFDHPSLVVPMAPNDLIVPAVGKAGTGPCP